MNSFAAFDMNCFHKLLAMLSLQVDEVSLLTTPSYDWEASVVNRPHSDITYWGDRRAHGIFRKWESLIKLMRFHILDTFTKGYNVIWFYHRPGFDSSYNSLTEVKDSTNVKICRKKLFLNWVTQLPCISFRFFVYLWKLHMISQHHQHYSESLEVTSSCDEYSKFKDVVRCKNRIESKSEKNKFNTVTQQYFI